MLPVVEVSIDQRAVVPCPAVGFRPRRAARACPACPYFDGIGEMSAGPVLPWDKRYAIRCGHVIERRTQIVEVLES